MRYARTAVIIAFFWGVTGVSAQETKSLIPLTDVLTLEMSFGDKDLMDEYFLANPNSVAVNSRNDIYVIDERRIKVFDKNGKEKVILGNPGQGPGEFIGNGLITINSRGYFSVSKVAIS